MYLYNDFFMGIKKKQLISDRSKIFIFEELAVTEIVSSILITT